MNTQAERAAQKKYRKALEKCLDDLAYAKAYIPLYNEITVQKDTYRHFNCFYFSAVAVFNDLITRSCRVLDKHKDAVGFWYLFKCEGPKILDLLSERQISIKDICSLAEKLKKVRDKVHFHHDKARIINPDQAWKEADIKWDVFCQTLGEIFVLLVSLYEQDFDDIYRIDDYRAHEVKLVYDACKASGNFKKIFMPCIRHDD